MIVGSNDLLAVCELNLISFLERLREDTKKRRIRPVSSDQPMIHSDLISLNPSFICQDRSIISDRFTTTPRPFE